MQLNPEEASTKILLVESDTVLELNSSNSLPVFLALEKTYRNGWAIRFWSHKPAFLFSSILHQLKELGVWNFTEPMSGCSLFLFHGDANPENKLAILERDFGQYLDDGGDLVFVDKYESHSEMIAAHVRNRFPVHLAPVVWENILALESDRIDSYLLHRTENLMSA